MKRVHIRDFQRYPSLYYEAAPFYLTRYNRPILAVNNIDITPCPICEGKAELVFNTFSTHKNKDTGQIHHVLYPL